MIRLNTEQKNFLEKYNFTKNDLFDAEGMKVSEYKVVMKSKDMLLAANTTPCKRAGHTIRTRAGRCVMCEPAALRYLFRYNSPGYVYMAYSQEKNLIKVGIAKNVKSRMWSLKKSQYASANDWALLLSSKEDEAGDSENMLHQVFSEYVVSGCIYDNGGTIREAREVFRLDKKIAIELFRQTLGKNDAPVNRSMVASKPLKTCKVASYIYLAYSKYLNLGFYGISKNIGDTKEELKTRSFLGADDWKLIDSHRKDNPTNSMNILKSKSLMLREIREGNFSCYSANLKDLVKLFQVTLAYN